MLIVEKERGRLSGVTASMRRGYSKEAVHREEDIKNYRESWSREQQNRIGALDLFGVLQSNHLLKIGNFPARENIFSSAASTALIADQHKWFLRNLFSQISSQR